MKRTKSPGRKPRGRASKAAPFNSLGEAIEFTRIVFEEGGGMMSVSELAKAAKQAPTSSRFHRRIGSAKAFGLIKTTVIKKTRERRVRIEDIGKKILAPHSPGEREGGKYEALITVPEFKKLLEIYQDAVPGREYIANMLGDEFQIPEDMRNAWVDCFMKSCQDAEIIYQVKGKEYFSRPSVPKKVIAKGRVSYEAPKGVRSSGEIETDQVVTPDPASAELGVLPPLGTYEESPLFEFPPTSLVGGTVSNISFVNMDKITPEGIEQFLEVSRGIAELLKARIPKEKKEGDLGEPEAAHE